MDRDGCVVVANIVSVGNLFLVNLSMVWPHTLLSKSCQGNVKLMTESG